MLLHWCPTFPKLIIHLTLINSIRERLLNDKTNYSIVHLFISKFNVFTLQSIVYKNFYYYDGNATHTRRKHNPYCLQHISVYQNIHMHTYIQMYFKASHIIHGRNTGILPELFFQCGLLLLKLPNYIAFPIHFSLEHIGEMFFLISLQIHVFPQS